MDIEKRKILVHVMENVRLRRAVKKLRAKGKQGKVIAISALFAGSMLSGCVAANPGGFRLTASLGAEQVQDHTDTYTVKDKAPCGGIKAWLVGCGDTLPVGGPRGS
jgi:hypothetical protein